MKISTAFGSIVTIVTLGAAALLSGPSFADDLDLEAVCTDELGGVYGGSTCTVTTETETPYADMIRPSGKSGLGWTAVGVIVETTVETYGIETEETETEVFVPAGTPNFQGCETSGTKPQKCFDHYKTVTAETSSWVSVDLYSTVTKVATGCFNPGGQNMGSHKHCGI